MRPKYEYQGKYYNIDELSDISGIPCHALRSRIKHGWSIEDTVEIAYEPRFTTVDTTMRGKPLWVMFEVPLASVLQRMQPELRKPYLAIPNMNALRINQTKDYYIIHLANGKPLIVYPNEFSVLRLAEGGEYEPERPADTGEKDPTIE